MTALVKLCEASLGIRNSAARIPFRYGAACLTHCPQAMLQVACEVDGKQQLGYASDCLPPGWFDKNQEKSYRWQVEEMLSAIQCAADLFGEELAQPAVVFDAWLSVLERVQEHGRSQGWTPLLASFGVSMVERAILDATARRHNVGFARAVRAGLYGIRPGEVFAELAGAEPSEWLPSRLAKTIHVRHTVGLGDPLADSDIPPDDRVHDGRPQSLEDYLRTDGISYLKVKVSNQLDRDLDRLERIANLAESHVGENYRVTLDGNEQYKTAEDVLELTARISEDSRLSTFWRNVLVIEQPLARQVALEATHAEGMRKLGAEKPVIIDESDGHLDSAAVALDLGYRGVSSKCCKGPLKSILNAGLVWLRNNRGQSDDYVMTGEDLCTLGVVAVQSDLCLVQTLGLTHVEKNGHHFMPGLDHLGQAEQQAALAAHPDFYHAVGTMVMPKVEQGRFQIESLGCEGFGFRCLPDFESWIPRDAWEFESLGLEE